MEKKTNLQKLPDRIKYYLLDWKDKNLNEYLKIYGEIRLNEMSLKQLHDLFSYTTTKDNALFNKLT